MHKVREVVGPVSAVADAIARDGYAVVDRVLAADEVARATDALDATFTAEADVAGDRGWLTAAHRVAYCLPAKERTFLDLCTHPGLLTVARSVLGDDCVVAGFNGLDLPAGSPGQDLHRDHPVPTPGTTLYLHVVVALDAFTTANGATVVVPGSHRDVGATRPPAEQDEPAVAVPVAAGGAVAFDGAVVHAAGPNRTGDRRRALHVFFARPWVQPHWDVPASLPPDVASTLSDEQRRILGVTARPRRWVADRRRVER